MTDIFDRHGDPIDYLRWAELHRDYDYVTVGRDDLGGMEISTVWLGLNHSFRDGPPQIFETMLFGGPLPNWSMRYSTEEEAVRGHIVIFNSLLDGRVLLAAAREISNGKERHGRVKWARDIRRHYRKSATLPA